MFSIYLLAAGALGIFSLLVLLCHANMTCEHPSTFDSTENEEYKCVVSCKMRAVSWQNAREHQALEHCH